MAEVLGTVAAGLGVAAFGFQLIDCGLKLKLLKDSVKDAPNNLNRLSVELRILGRVLSSLHTQHCQPKGDATESSLLQSIAFCHDLTKPIRDTAASLEKYIMSPSKKHVAVFKSLLKKEWIDERLVDLERAKTTLLLALQSHSL